MSLTDEDKTWIEATIKEIVMATETRMLTEMHAVEGRAREFTSDIETRLLTEFQKWASPMEARQRTHTATLKAIDAEMEYLSDRVKKLESPQPPHA
jgi:hypothetical protein